jgi:hypothetical protein
MERKMKQPNTIDLQIPCKGNSVMYSMMDEFSLRRLHKFIGELIAWREAGNRPDPIEQKLYAVIERIGNGR